MTSVILLTGQYGTSHEVVARSLCTLIQEHQPQSTAAYYSVEDEIWDILPADSFFELQTDRERDTYWHRAFSRVKRKIDDAAPRFAFVSVHAVYLWKKRFFSCLDWDRLLTIPVRVILTLIDDVYDVHVRIASQQAADGGRIPDERLSLQEILGWRSREIQTCNLLAKHLRVNPHWFPTTERFLRDGAEAPEDAGINVRELGQVFGTPCDHFVISIKQEANDFYRLLFDRKKVRVYASFPISEPREKNDQDYFDKLLQWRKRIHEAFVVFDPLAIDELRFARHANGEIDSQLRSRWPYGLGVPIVPSVQPNDTWGLDELQSICDGVIQQVSERDFKLEGQAEVTAQYRPLYGRGTHGGVDAEGVFARAKGIQLHSFIPDEDRRSYKAFPGNFGVNHDTEPQLFKALKALQQGYAKTQSNDTY